MSTNNCTAAIYARVSTNVQSQSLATQIELCQKVADFRGFNVVMIASERISGSARKLPERNRILSAAHRGEFNTLMVTRLDRFGRSTTDLVNTLNELQSINVNFIAVEQSLDLSSSIGKFHAGIFALIAEFEKDLIKERVKEGLQAARRRGVVLGRRKAVTPKVEAEIVELLKTHSQLDIADLYDINKSVVYRIRKKYYPDLDTKTLLHRSRSNPVGLHSIGEEDPCKP